MPTYEYFCEIHGEFEESHSITIKLEYCPKCGAEGKEQPIKRLISLGAKGVVELSGQELIDQVKSDAKKLQKDAAKSEKIYSNLLGESKYEKLQQQMDARKR